MVQDGSFASLVDRPLPSNFIVADALEPFDPPQPENDGRCQSKYVILDASSTFHLRVKDTKHWEDMKNDPVFRPVPKSARVISLQRILSMYRPREQGGEQKQAELEEGEWSQHTDVQVDEGRDVMDRLEHSLGAGHSMEPPAAVSRKASWDHVARRKSSTYSRPDRSSEDANTSRGIDGPHWPHQNTMRPYPPPPAREESPVPSPERTPPVRSRTPSMYEL